MDMYDVYMKPTSDPGIYINWKWRDEKDTPCKWKSKENWSSNTHIKQNRLYKIETVIRDKEGHYITIKGTAQEEGTTILSIYAPKYKHLNT